MARRRPTTPPAPAGLPALPALAAARQLLTAFALHPAPLPADWLHALAPRAEAVDSLREGGWIQENPDGTWQLAPLAERAALTRRLAWSARQRCHRLLAELASRTPAGLLLAAEHWAHAGQRPAAAGACLAAAEAAQAAHDPAAALAACRALRQHGGIRDLAPELVPRVIAVLERGATSPAGAEPFLDEIATWLNDAPAADRSRWTARLAPLLAQREAAAGRHLAGAELRLRAARALQQLGDAAGAARQLVATTTVLTFALQHSTARTVAAEAVAAADASGDPVLRAQAASILGLLLGMQGETAAGRRQLERALDLALQHQLTALAAEAYRLLGNVAEYASCYGDQQAAFSRALAYCRRHDMQRTTDLCLGCLSFSLFRTGHWTRSRRIARAVLDRRDAPPGSRCVADGVLGLMHAHRGELREATRYLERSSQVALEIGIYGMELFCRWGIALVEEQAGRAESAALQYRRLLDFWRGTEDRHDCIPGLTAGALFFADRGDHARCQEFGAALQTCALATGNPEAQGAFLLVNGACCARAGRFDTAAQAIRDALQAFTRRDLVMERIRGLIRLAAVLEALGDTAGARDAAREAKLRARRLGARALVTGAEDPASAAAPAATDAWSGLSPRQRDVARHLANGLSNKEVAARLGLSVRTVDMHVSHLLARLGCRSRTEAAARIARLLE